MSGPGRLIIFEGPEGAGKTTQVRLLAGRLAAAGLPHLAVREPGQTPVGDAIRRLLLDSDHEIAPAAEALLFMASRAQLMADVVRPALGRGTVVIADRFFLSTYAYQVAGRGLPEAQVRAANQLATGGLAPDLTILLELPVREGLARADRRGAPDRIERLGEAFHDRVAGAFRRYADPTWQRDHPECGTIVPLRADGTEGEVHGRVAELLAGRWPETFGALAGSQS